MKTIRPLLALALILALAAPASAALPAKGTYKGKTSQNRSVTIKVNAARKVASLRFVVKNDCGATRKAIEVTGPFKVKEATGRFSASLSNSAGSLTFSGRFKNGRVTGQVRERLTNDPLFGECDTGKVTFSAKR